PDQAQGDRRRAAGGEGPRPRAARHGAQGPRASEAHEAQVSALGRVRRRAYEERSWQGRQEAAPRARTKRRAVRMTEKFLARHTTASLYSLLKEGKRAVVALVPIGSTEPHGPHLGLGTDVVISAAACVRACELLEKKGPITSVIAPAVSYG